MTLSRRYRRGAAALFAVLLLMPLVGAATVAWHAAADAARREASWVDAGRVFGAWVAAAHRASQEHRGTWPDDLTTAPGFAVTTAALRGLGGVPPGLRDGPGRGMTMTLGVMDDGSGVAGLRGVAMAWGVLEATDAGAIRSARLGVLGVGLADVASVSLPSGTPIEAHRARVEAALGRALSANALYVTADYGIRFNEATLYRRRQPGRPWLARMETALDAGGQAILAAAVVDGRMIAVECRDAEGASVACPADGPDGNVQVLGREVVPGTAAPPSLVEGSAAVGTAGSPASVTVTGPVGVLNATRLTAYCVVAAGAPPGACLSAGALDAGALSVISELVVDSVIATGRIGAGRLETVGSAEAGSMVVGSGTTSGNVRAGDVEAWVFEAANSLVATGAATTSGLVAGGLTAASMNTRSGAADHVYGQSANINRLSVSGGCSGC